LVRRESGVPVPTVTASLDASIIRVRQLEIDRVEESNILIEPEDSDNTQVIGDFALRHPEKTMKGRKAPWRLYVSHYSTLK
jgi:hypothetical protein